MADLTRLRFDNDPKLKKVFDSSHTVRGGLACSLQPATIRLFRKI